MSKCLAVTPLPCAEHKSCPKPCSFVLPCGHQCKGHAVLATTRLIGTTTFVCKRVSKINTCGHQCEGGCAKSCPPCKRPCDFDCGTVDPNTITLVLIAGFMCVRMIVLGMCASKMHTTLSRGVLGLCATNNVRSESIVLVVWRQLLRFVR